jgi:hypothetical protein
MKKMRITTLLSIVMMMFFASHLLSQENPNKAKINLGADIVSSYIWRGLVADQSPNIQPSLSLGIGNFTVGSWASVNFTGTYKEIDLYASYAIKKFTFTVTDYMWSPSIDQLPYFDYRSETTGHYIESALAYKGSEKFPVSILAATMLYGADKKIDNIDEVTLDTNYVNQYSTYIEFAYSFFINGYRLDPVLGLTPAEGGFGDSFGVTNLGVSGFRTIKFSDKFELPMKASLLFNPQASRAYFVFGITL